MIRGIGRLRARQSGYDLLDAYIIEGHSIAQGYYATGLAGYSVLVQAMAPRLVGARMMALSGSKLTDMSARLLTLQSNINAEIAAGRRPIVSVEIGANDKSEMNSNLAGYFASLQSYAASVRSYGAKVIMCTEIAANPAVYPTYNNTDRPAFNALIRANPSSWDGICDFAANANVNVWNGTYFFDDHHPNDAGHAVMRDIIKPAIDLLRATS